MTQGYISLRDPEHVDLNHIYIDGSKFEASANKYTWVWKKSTEKSRYKLFEKITTLLDQINETLAFSGVKMQTNTLQFLMSISTALIWTALFL